MKKKLIYIGIFASLLVSCTESLEDKAAREAKEYTEKYCPTPYVNDARTDSAAFDKTKKIYTYYISLRNKADNKKAIDANKDKLHKIQKEALDNNPGLKKYKEEHFTFRFVYDTLQSGDDLLCLHAFNQSTNALGIAIAASDELGILHISIFIYTDADVF